MTRRRAIAATAPDASLPEALPLTLFIAHTVARLSLVITIPLHFQSGAGQPRWPEPARARSRDPRCDAGNPGNRPVTRAVGCKGERKNTIQVSGAGIPDANGLYHASIDCAVIGSVSCSYSTSTRGPFRLGFFALASGALPSGALRPLAPPLGAEGAFRFFESPAEGSSSSLASSSSSSDASASSSSSESNCYRQT